MEANQCKGCKTAAQEITSLTTLLAERDADIKYFAEQSLKVIEDIKYLNGCVVKGRGCDIDTEFMRNNVFQYIKELEKQLAASQQECERLKEELEAADWVGEQACKAIIESRKQAAMECIDILNTKLVIHGQANLK